MAGTQSVFLKQKSLLRNNLDTQENDRKADETALVTGHPKKLPKNLPQAPLPIL